MDDPLRGLLEEALPGGSHKKAKGGKHKNNSSADVPSAAENAAMVAGAVSELGDGETHPVTWKQIKTWFENRRMTQKRIKEGAARPSRRYVPSRLGDEKERRRSADDFVRESDASGAAGRGTARGAPGTQARKSDTIRGKKAGTPTQTLANTPPTAPRTSRASLDETRFDSGGRVPHGVKRKMKKRGVNGTLGLRRFVRLADADGNGEVDAQEFAAAMESVGMGLTPCEARLLFQYFDKDGSGAISFEEFQLAICGDLNDRRRLLVLYKTTTMKGKAN